MIWIDANFLNQPLDLCNWHTRYASFLPALKEIWHNVFPSSKHVTHPTLQFPSVPHFHVLQHRWKKVHLRRISHFFSFNCIIGTTGDRERTKNPLIFSLPSHFLCLHLLPQKEVERNISVGCSGGLAFPESHAEKERLGSTTKHAGIKYAKKKKKSRAITGKEERKKAARGLILRDKRSRYMQKWFWLQLVMQR